MKNKQKQFNIKEKKQVNALKDLRSKDQTKLNKFLQKIMKVILKLLKIKRYTSKVIRDNLFYESSNQIYDYRIFKTIKSFGDSIYHYKIEIHEANQEQADLLEYILSFNSKTKPMSDDNCDSAEKLYAGRELVVNVFEKELFPLKSKT